MRAVGRVPFSRAANVPVAVMVRQQDDVLIAQRAQAGYLFQNEIWLTECFCPATQKRFQDHLRRKLGLSPSHLQQEYIAYEAALAQHGIGGAFMYNVYGYSGDEYELFPALRDWFTLALAT